MINRLADQGLLLLLISYLLTLASGPKIRESRIHFLPVARKQHKVFLPCCTQVHRQLARNSIFYLCYFERDIFSFGTDRGKYLRNYPEHCEVLKDLQMTFDLKKNDEKIGRSGNN